MLLVDNDESEILQRGEHGRAGADDDGTPSFPCRAPRVVALAYRHPAVHHGHPLLEMMPEPADDLRGEGDLRHEDDGVLSARERVADRLDVDLRLPAAGDTVEEESEGRMADFRGQRSAVRGQSNGHLLLADFWHLVFVL